MFIADKIDEALLNLETVKQELDDGRFEEALDELVIANGALDAVEYDLRIARGDKRAKLRPQQAIRETERLQQRALYMMIGGLVLAASSVVWLLSAGCTYPV